MVLGSDVKLRSQSHPCRHEPPVTTKAKLALVFVVLTQFAFFSFVAGHRFIDGDEGAFLLAAKLVLMHKRPYLDFFYQQAPLLPYVYAAWMKVAGLTWSAGRILCVLLATLLGGLIYQHVLSLTQRCLAALIAVSLYITSTLVFAWFSVVKTHCLAGVLLFASYAVITRNSTRFSRWPLAVAGTLLGLSIDTRSYVLLLIPVFLWWVYANSEHWDGARSTGWFCLGLVVGMLPSLYLFICSPDAFVFNNLRYHSLRTGAGLIGWWQEKVFTLIELFIGGPEANGLQWSILFFVSLGFVFAIKQRKYPPRLAFVIAVVLAFVCLLPTPAYLQYFSLCVAFLVVSAVCVAAEFYSQLESLREKRTVLAVCLVTLIGYVVFGAYDLRSYAFTGNGVPGVHIAQDRADWSLQRVVKVSRAIDEISYRNEPVASFWSGDIFQTKTQSIAGLESPFSLTVAEKLSPEQRAKYHIVTLGELEASFALRQPRIVVIRTELSSAFSQEELPRAREIAESLKTLLAVHGYTAVRSIGGISIYLYRPH